MKTWDYEVIVEKKESAGVRTLWLHPGETRRILFLSDAPEVRYEHELWGLARTRELDECRAVNGGECPWCTLPWETRREHGLRVRTVGYFTVLELGVVQSDGSLVGWRDKEGRERRGIKRILRAKAGSTKRPGVLDILRRKAQRYGGLLWCVFDVTRGGEQSPSVGDEWELVERLKNDAEAMEYIARSGVEYTAGMLDEVDYGTAIEYISPARRAELLRGLGVDVVVEAGDLAAGEEVLPGSEEDTPF